MAIQNWRLSQLAMVGAASLCAELWAIRALHRMEKGNPLLAGGDAEVEDNPYLRAADAVDYENICFFWKHFTLEALVFAIIPGIVLFVAWQWVAKKEVPPET